MKLLQPSSSSYSTRINLREAELIQKYFPVGEIEGGNIFVFLSKKQV
jgi:hypothetical protein